MQKTFYHCLSPVQHKMSLILPLLLLASSSLAQETALLTGGFNGYEGGREGCELLNSACSVPSFPVVSNLTGGSNRADREDHITDITEDGLILSCGGEAGDGSDDLSCIFLDVTTGSWFPHSILTAVRLKATSVVLPSIGLFILGGFKELSSELLPVGTKEWEAGPILPGTNETVDYYGICSIVLSPTEFMVIGGNAGGIRGTPVQAYSAETGEWDIWEDLYIARWGHSCTRLGDQVVVAGGVSPMPFTILDSTTILDLNTRQQREVGKMLGARAWFGMATLDGKVLAFGGMSPLKDSYSSILELDIETEEWVQREDTMATAYGISSFASVVVQQEDICLGLE